MSASSCHSKVNLSYSILSLWAEGNVAIKTNRFSLLMLSGPAVHAFKNAANTRWSHLFDVSTTVCAICNRYTETFQFRQVADVAFICSETLQDDGYFVFTVDRPGR